MMNRKLKFVVLLVPFLLVAKVYAGDGDQAIVNAAMSQAEPLTPSEIKVFKKHNAAVQAAMSVQGLPSNETGNTIRVFRVGSGESPPTITLVSGYATNISFVGQNGAAWPIISIMPGDNNIISVSKPGKDAVDNANLFVKRPYANTNFFAYLKGRSEPILVYVKTKGDSASGLSANVVFHVNGTPPGTLPLPVKNVSGVSNALLNATNYSPGPSWVPVSIKSSETYPFQISVWHSPDGQDTIVRIENGNLISPSYVAESKAGNVSAYEFNYAPLLYTISDNSGSLYTVALQNVTGQLASQDASQYLSVSKRTNASMKFLPGDRSNAVNEFQQIMYDENPNRIRKLATGSNLFGPHKKGGAILLRWTFKRGSLKSNIERLAKNFGYQKVIWKASTDPSLPNEITISGKTLDALLTKLLNHHNLHVKSYKNKVMVIVNG
jgi:hypothetical protein